MEITITWTKIIVVTLTYFSARYIYYSFLKWYSGSYAPFDPTEFHETSSYSEGWKMGHLHGSHKLRIRCEKYRRQIAEVKEKHRISNIKVKSLEDKLLD
jgi:hypothetical protein